MVKIGCCRSGNIVTFTVLDTGQVVSFKDGNSSKRWKEYLSTVPTGETHYIGFYRGNDFTLFSRTNSETNVRIKCKTIDVRITVSDEEAMPVLKHISRC